MPTSDPDNYNSKTKLNRTKEFWDYLESLRAADPTEREQAVQDLLGIKGVTEAADNLVAEVAGLDPSNIDHLRVILGVAAFKLGLSKPGGRPRHKKLIADLVDFAIDVHATMKGERKPLYISQLASAYCAAKGLDTGIDAVRIRLGRLFDSPALEGVPESKLADYRAAIEFIGSCRRDSKNKSAAG